MNYELYTVPKCDGCDAVKQFLNEKGINYSVWDLRDEEHKKYFGKIYIKIDGKLRKNVQHKTILPLLVEKNESGDVERLAQELDEIKNLFN